MKKLLFLAVFLPFFALAANSVEITGVSLQGYTATANGTSVYDTETSTAVSFDTGDPVSTTATAWSISKALKAGTHIVQASVGSAKTSFTFDIHSNEGGMRACQWMGECPTFGMFAPTIPNQIPNQNEKPKEIKPTIPLLNFWQDLQKYLIK